jgi:hypothetical protein
MITAKKRLFSIIGWSSFLVIPLWARCIWVFGGDQLVLPYLLCAYLLEILSVTILFVRRDSLFWYFSAILFSAFPSLVLSFALITGTLLMKAFGQYLSPNIVSFLTLCFYTIYCFFPFNYYYNDYHRTKKERLKSFDFNRGTYDISSQSIIRGDAFADYYTKSILSKINYGIIRLHLLFPISGGAIAIIAGKISKSLQLGIGLFAFITLTILFIQGLMAGVFNAWQVRQLEKLYGKKIKIDWGE